MDGSAFFATSDYGMGANPIPSLVIPATPVTKIPIIEILAISAVAVFLIGDGFSQPVTKKNLAIVAASVAAAMYITRTKEK